MFEKKNICSYNEGLCEFAVAVANGDLPFTAKTYPSTAVVSYDSYVKSCDALKGQLDQLVDLYYAHASDERKEAYADTVKNARHAFKTVLKTFGSRKPRPNDKSARPLFNLDEGAFYALGLEMGKATDKDVARHITIMVGNVLQGRPAMEKTIVETKKEANKAQAEKAQKTAKSHKQILAEKDEKINQLESENTALKAVSIDLKALTTLINKSHATDEEKLAMLKLLHKA